MTEEELERKYKELNDFSNSQCAKLLRENSELKAQIEKNEVLSKLYTL